MNGIYATKRYSEKNSKNYIGVGDPYKTKGKQRSIYKGKQFQTNPPLLGQTAGYFNKISYKESPYQQSEKYLSRYPSDSRKLGFGSRDCPRRDEYSQTIRANQMREEQRKEARHAKNTLFKNAATPEKPREGETPQDMRQRKYTEKYKNHPSLFQTQVPYQLYDIGRTHTTPFNPKSKGDTFYDIRTVAQNNLRRPGTCPTSYGVYGNYGGKYPTEKPKYGCVTETKAFYDSGHLSTSHGMF